MEDPRLVSAALNQEAKGTTEISQKIVEKKKKYKKAEKKKEQEDAVKQPGSRDDDDKEKNEVEEENTVKEDRDSSSQEELETEKQPKKEKSKRKLLLNENNGVKRKEEKRVDFLENNIDNKKKKQEKKDTETIGEIKDDNHEKKSESKLSNGGRKIKKKDKDKSIEKAGTSYSLQEERTGSYKKHKKKEKEQAINKSSSSRTKEQIIGQGDTLTKECGTSGSSKKKRKKAADSCVSEDAPKGKARRVSFSGEVEMFPPHNDSDDTEADDENNLVHGKAYDENNLVRGKRFSAEEDQLIMDAVYKFIEINQLGEEGVKMVLNSRRYPQTRHCWKEIGTALPWRPWESVSGRGHILLERSEKRGFTKEENEVIRKFHAENGPQWKKLSEVMGKHRNHIKDSWRRIRLPNVKTGQWSQDEYQTLFDTVNLDLRMRAFEDTKSSNVMIRENISWEAISDKLTTRTMSSCCHKWYDQLTSPFVREGIWADTDDYRLLASLHKQDACNVEDVEWDSLLEHRSGELCRKRWEEMVRHIGGYRERTFLEQVDVLAKRYCADMLKCRKSS